MPVCTLNSSSASYGRQEDIGVEVHVGVVHAVERVVVELAPLAGDRDLLVGARTALAVASLAGAGETRRSRSG
jgi:hypothetical protein